MWRQLQKGSERQACFWTDRFQSAVAWMGPLVLLATALAGCGGGTGVGSKDESTAAPSNSAGQVANGGNYKVSHYAASRFAEQASFGPTPALVQEIRTKGIEKWIDDQFALQPSLVEMKVLENYALANNSNGDPRWTFWQGEYQRLWLTAPDQLRLRVSWSISQFIVTSTNKSDVAAAGTWLNLLQRRGLGNYAELLYAVTIDAGMGNYLDNNQNRPKSAECPHCAPNENYARELMQLFTLGVFKLGPDGVPLRNARGSYIETYAQTDVEQLARVLTGWQFNPDPPTRQSANWANWTKPMVPSTWPPERDSGEKKVLGRVFPAGQTTEQDLRDAISLLMSHQNVAPFVSLRMIQHLVKSNPTPAYVGRVAAAFRSNRGGVSGDMQAVVKAVLLDPEARAGDDPAKAQADDGKLREPVLHRMAVLRGLSCQAAPLYSWGGVSIPNSQRPFAADSVFSFYAPTDRAPGSNVLAPEQKLITAPELTFRLGDLSGLRYRGNKDGVAVVDMSAFAAAGCVTEPLTKAFVASSRSFSDYLSERWFRGAMPPTLRSNIEQLMNKPSWDTHSPDDGAMRMLSYALTTPYYGVAK